MARVPRRSGSVVSSLRLLSVKLRVGGGRPHWDRSSAATSAARWHWVLWAKSLAAERHLLAGGQVVVPDDQPARLLVGRSAPLPAARRRAAAPPTRAPLAVPGGSAARAGHQAAPRSSACGRRMWDGGAPGAVAGAAPSFAASSRRRDGRARRSRVSIVAPLRAARRRGRTRRPAACRARRRPRSSRARRTG